MQTSSSKRFTHRFLSALEKGVVNEEEAMVANANGSAGADPNQSKIVPPPENPSDVGGEGTADYAEEAEEDKG
jgi:hypothetical protein